MTKPKYANSMFLIGNVYRWEINYVLEDGGHDHALIDAETKDDAIEFLKEKENVKRIESVYKC